MRFTVAIEITRPREQVVRLLSDPVHLPAWLRGLELHEPISGTHGRVGTQSRVVMRTGQHSMEATETVTRLEPTDLDDIPRGTVVRYERELVADGMWNAARERLTDAGPGATLWTSENEYRFSGTMRFLAPLMRGVFRKQTLRHMQDFKAFAEDGTDVRDATD